jgi:death-on-curing protein
VTGEPKWLLPDVVVQFHEELIQAHGGGGTTLRDRNALEAACARPRQLHAYGQPTLPELAACLALGIAKKHPFVDGNKRAALTAMGTFLAINGLTFTASEAAAAVALTMVADGSLDEAGLARFIEEHV